MVGISTLTSQRILTYTKHPLHLIAMGSFFGECIKPTLCLQLLPANATLTIARHQPRIGKLLASKKAHSATTEEL